MSEASEEITFETVSFLLKVFSILGSTKLHPLRISIEVSVPIPHTPHYIAIFLYTRAALQSLVYLILLAII